MPSHSQITTKHVHQTEVASKVEWFHFPKFDIKNGVRQGGVLSPILFTVYVDDLLVKLKRNGIGCHIGYQFVGALGYADDIILLCTSVAVLKKIMKFCKDYAEQHKTLFNGSKRKYLIFGDYIYIYIIQL